MRIISVDVYGEKFTGTILKVYSTPVYSKLSTEPLNHKWKSCDREWFVEFAVTDELIEKYKLSKDEIESGTCGTTLLTWELPCTNVVIEHD